MNDFEQLGFFKEYYIGNKLIGTTSCEKDREIGYAGRKSETLFSEVKLNEGKKIKQGTEVSTMIYPLCGKLLNKTR